MMDNITFRDFEVKNTSYKRDYFFEFLSYEISIYSVSFQLYIEMSIELWAKANVFVNLFKSFDMS